LFYIDKSRDAFLLIKLPCRHAIVGLRFMYLLHSDEAVTLKKT